MVAKRLWKRSGITLIEVVVGLTMLATILTVLLSSVGKFDKIAVAALEKSRAVKELDELVAVLYRDGFPKDSTLRQHDTETGWWWQITRRPWREAPDRFDIGQVSIQKMNSESDSIVLASVELLLRK